MAQKDISAFKKQQIFDDAYEILATIGRGQDTVVYKARSLEGKSQADKPVALKVCFKPSVDVSARRLKREALCLLATRHENIVRLIDYRATEEYCYIALEFAEGGSLQQILSKCPNGLPWQQAINIMKQILAALSSVHRAGIVHRDIKPENVLLNDQGVVKLSDFSLACFPHEDNLSDEAQRGMGTLEYIAPETLQSSETTIATDIYAAGITFFQMLTGNFPFPNESIASHAQAKLQGHRAKLADYVDVPSAGFEQLIHIALAEQPRARYQSAEEFLNELERLEQSLFGYSGNNKPTERVVRTVPVRGNLTASSDNRFLEQHQSFRYFQEEVTSGDTALVPVEAAIAHPFAAFFRSASNLADTFLGSAFGRVLFAMIGLVVFYALYLVTANLENPHRKEQSALGALNIHNADRVMQTFYPFIHDDIHVGIARGVFGDDTDVPIYFRRGEAPDTFVFGIGIAGWEEATFSLEQLSAARDLTLRHSRGSVTFQIEGRGEQSNIVWGRYVVGEGERQGKWILW